MIKSKLIALYDDLIEKDNGIRSDIYRHYKPKFITKDKINGYRLGRRIGQEWWVSLFLTEMRNYWTEVEIWEVSLRLYDLLFSQKTQNDYIIGTVNTKSGLKAYFYYHNQYDINIEHIWIFK